MASLPIDLNQAKRIVSNTVELTNNICETLSLYPHQLLPRPNQGIHTRELKDFVDNIVLFEQWDKWGKGGYPEDFTAGTLPLFHALDVRDVPRNDLGGYGSWLYTGRIPGTFCVVFDGQEINRICRGRQKNPDETKFKLFLHELGHFVLHRTKLFETTPPMHGATSAEAEWEVEAWLFASVIIGLAIGDHAYQSKILDSPDRSWMMH